MGKVDVKKQLKKDALFSAAFDLFTNEETQKASISDIARNAGVAKGTFYLYFKDKYDIRNRLIQRKASQLFARAAVDLRKRNLERFEDQIIFLADHVIDQLSEDRRLVYFISKNLSWGLFKNALLDAEGDFDEDVPPLYDELLLAAQQSYDNPELLLYMIVELVNSSTYSSILYNEPVPIAELKPYLYRTIRVMLTAHQIREDRQG